MFGERARDWRAALAAPLAIAAATWALPPVGEFPVCDDWDYRDTVVDLLIDRRVRLSDWPAMTLLTHVAWGAAFALVGGTGYFTLRIATLTALALGCVALFFLSRRLGLGRRTGAFLSLALAFSPLTWLYANTFMTDVTGMALGLAVALAGARCVPAPGEARPRLHRWLALSALASAAYLCRQPAALPGLALAILCVRRQPRGELLGFALPLACVAATHHVWLHQFHGLPHSASLPRLDLALPLRPADFARRSAELLLELSFFAAPALLAGGVLPKRGERGPWAAALAAGAALAWWTPQSPFRFVFGAIGVRIDATSFGYIGMETQRIAHAGLLPALARALAAWAFAASAARLWRARDRLRAQLRDPWRASLALAAAAWLASMALGTVHFERYYLPVLALALPLAATLSPRRAPSPAAWLTTAALAAFALVGTRDYFDRQRAWWRAADGLLARGVDPADVSASFEYCGVHRFAPVYRNRAQPRSGPFLLTRPAQDLPMLYATFWPDTVSAWNRRHAVGHAVPAGYEVLESAAYCGWLAGPGEVHALRRTDPPPPKPRR